MKKTISTIAAAIIIASAIVGSSCQSADNKTENARENLNEAERELDQALIDSVNQFKRESAIIISNNEKIIADFKARTVSEKKENKAQYEEKVTELEQQNKELKKKLENYNDVTQDNWASFKKEFNHDMDKLGKAFKGLTTDDKM